MITLEQYKSEYNKYIDKLTELKDRASRIKIWGYDRSPSMLMRRIETCIEKMKRCTPFSQLNHSIKTTTSPHTSI